MMTIGQTLFIASALVSSGHYFAQGLSSQVVANSAPHVAASQIRSLLTENQYGSGTWGTRGDLMGLLVRLAFHDGATFDPGNSTAKTTGGSDGCVDLKSPENKGLQEAIDLLEPIHESVSDELSRGDVWALAANVMIEEAGGPPLEYRKGRIDADLPYGCAGQGTRHVGAETTSSEKTAQVLVDRLNLTHSQVVALIGAHVLGKATKENSGYEGRWVSENDKFTNAYFVDLVHKPWIQQTETVEGFGKRTTWQLFEDGNMALEEEIMLQTDVDLAYQTTGGFFCSRVGGTFRKDTSCPNATHGFSDHVRTFAANQSFWFSEFALGWSRLTSMTTANLECVMPSCETPREEDFPASSASSYTLVSFLRGASVADLGSAIATALSVSSFWWFLV